MKKIGLIHTTPVTIEVLKPLAAELLPGVGVINIMDDSILSQLQESNGDLFRVADARSSPSATRVRDLRGSSR